MLHCIFFLKQNGATLHSQMLNWGFLSHLYGKCPPQHSEREQPLETAHVEAESTPPII